MTDDHNPQYFHDLVRRQAQDGAALDPATIVTELEERKSQERRDESVQVASTQISALLHRVERTVDTILPPVSDTSTNPSNQRVERRNRIHRARVLTLSAWAGGEQLPTFTHASQLAPDAALRAYLEPGAPGAVDKWMSVESRRAIAEGRRSLGMPGAKSPGKILQGECAKFVNTFFDGLLYRDENDEWSGPLVRAALTMRTGVRPGVEQELSALLEGMPDEMREEASIGFRAGRAGEPMPPLMS